MRVKRNQHGTKLWLSANDTYKWASRPDAAWLCSTLTNRRVFAEFDGRGDLVDLAIDGGRGNQDCDGHELDSIVADHLGSDHPVPTVQFCVFGRRKRYFATLEAAREFANRVFNATQMVLAIEATYR